MITWMYGFLFKITSSVKNKWIMHKTLVDPEDSSNEYIYTKIIITVQEGTWSSPHVPLPHGNQV